MPEIPFLSEHYYKARKSLALFSGLLFAWEFIGLEVTNTPFSNVAINVKNPNAAPFVLLVLVIYFMVRVIIEWKQSDETRRSFNISKIDYRMTLSFPIVAILTFFIQRLLNIQLADYLIEDALISSIGGLYGLSLAYLIMRVLILGYSIKGSLGIYYTHGTLILVGIVLFVVYKPSTMRPLLWFLISFVMMTLACIVGKAVSTIFSKIRASSKQPL